jgi:hypothetical protein
MPHDGGIFDPPVSNCADTARRQELAEDAGLTTNAVGALKRGERRRPYPNTNIQDLAKELDGEKFDVVCCHAVLEWLVDPEVSGPGITGTRWYPPAGPRPGPRPCSARRRAASRQGP